METAVALAMQLTDDCIIPSASRALDVHRRIVSGDIITLMRC